MRLRITFIFIGMFYTFCATAQERKVLSKSGVPPDLYTLDLFELMNVKISTASKKEETNLESPLSTTVITAQEIENSGATTVEEVFKMVPGMIVRQETNGNFDVHIRGHDNVPPGNYIFNSENNLTLVMIDGHKVYNHMNGGTLWETLPVSLKDICKIEIIRGAATALYGPNAVSGVINIITKKEYGESGIQLNANIQSGNYNTRLGQFRFNYTSENQKINLAISGNIDYRNRFDSLYYNYITQGFVNTDSLIDYTTGTFVGNKWAIEELSKNKWGTNVFLNYLDTSKKLELNFATGLQSSEIQAVFMENTITPLSFRESFLWNTNFNAKSNHWTTQVSSILGVQDIYVDGDYFKYNMSNLEFITEYNLKWNKFEVRPGVSIQSNTFNDLPHIPDGKEGRGVLNGKKTLQAAAISVKMDYKPFQKLRLMSALRLDRYNTNDKNNWTYQLVSTYQLSKLHLMRANFSHAIRGPFIYDTYTNFSDFNSVGQFAYSGNPELMLPVMNTFEIGYRGKLSKKMMVDIELFRSQYKNTSGLEVLSSEVDTSGTSLVVSSAYTNYLLRSIQYGLSYKLDWVLNDKIGLGIFGTIQKTKFYDLQQRTSNSIISVPEFETVDEENKYTPNFYGGLSFKYVPSPPLHIYINNYFFTQQEFSHRVATASIQPKFSTDIKVSYTMHKQNRIFFNARNVFNTTTNEFAMLDSVKGLYMVGFDFSL